MDTKEQVLSFFESCEELKKCKFIMATTKIKDLLKAIVNSSDLYRLFETVTKDFDYPAVKEKCLVTTDDGIFSKSFVMLPSTVGHRLAFIFCLLVEFDRDSINFNDFLRKYYPEDGSYYASYHAFCNQIIDGLRDCLNQVFREQLKGGAAFKADARKVELLSSLDIALSEEMHFIAEDTDLSDDEKEGGIKMLTELNAAIKSENTELMEALACGYNYFVLFNNKQSEIISDIMSMLVKFERLVGGEDE